MTLKSRANPGKMQVAFTCLRKHAHPPFWCNGGFPMYIFQKIMHKKKNKWRNNLENRGVSPPRFSTYTAGGADARKMSFVAVSAFFEFGIWKAQTQTSPPAVYVENGGGNPPNFQFFVIFLHFPCIIFWKM